MKAQLIGESSAGMTAVNIYDAENNPVWGHRRFDAGPTQSGYVQGMKHAWDCMRDCDDVHSYEGGMVEEDGDPMDMDSDVSTGIMLEYDSVTKKWTIGEDARSLGQSREIVDACMIAGLIPTDDEHEDTVDAVAEEIAAHIKQVIEA